MLIFGLLAVFLMGAAFLSLGLFISSMARNQVTAGTMTFAVWFVSYVLGGFAADLPEALPLPERWSAGIQGVMGFGYGVFLALARELPLDAHAGRMAQGIVRAEDITYYVAVTAFFLFLTFRAIEARRRKG